MKSRIFSFVTCILLMLTGESYGQTLIPTYRNFERLANGAVITVPDPDATVWTSITGTTSNPPVCQVGTDYYRIYKIYDRLSLTVDKDYKFSTDFDFSITFNIKIYDENNTLIQQYINQVLSLNYRVSDPYTHKKQVQYENTKCKNKLEVTIVSISNPSNIPLSHIVATGEIHKSRQQYMPATPANTVISGIGHTYTAGTKTLDIVWGSEDWASSYDLQWLYVDGYDSYVDGIDKISDQLMNSGTKVNLKKAAYSIPMMYDKGYIVYRVRGNGLVRGATVNTESEIPGLWQQSFDGIDLGSDPYSYHIVAGSQSALNWQSAVTFAEEGKKMLQASYFDGVSRERQKISLLSQAGKHNLETGMLEETVYDEEGRAAARILPAPTLLPHVQFLPGFNLSDQDNSLNFSSRDFDYYDPSDACRNTIHGLSTISGSSMYYSPFNPLLGTAGLTRMYSTLPDAARYPYALTVYTNDNTGRVSEQSGVGTAFKIGSSHTTKYFYGKPSQEDLDRLFGCDAGYATNYQKDMVKDANGQFSISYKDLSGRVIATSLAGARPQNVDRLESQPVTLPLVRADLLNKVNGNNVDEDDNDKHGVDDVLYPVEGKRVLSSEIVVSTEGKRDFYYKIKNNSFDPQCLETGNPRSTANSNVKAANFIASGTFHTTLPTGILDLKILDIDNDGDEDVVYTLAYKIVILQNRMGGNAVDAESFYEVVMDFPSFATPLLELRDLDKDKNPELIVYSESATSYTIYKNYSDRVQPSFVATKTISIVDAIKRIIAIDDEDNAHAGKIWIVATNSGSYKVHVHEIVPSSSVEGGLYNINATAITGISPSGGDINLYLEDIIEANAGKEIIIAAADGNIYVYSTSFSLLTVGGISPGFSGVFNLVFAHLNNDSYIDVIAYSNGYSTAKYLLGGTLATFNNLLTATSGAIVTLIAADFNLDKRTDIILSNDTELEFFENNSSTSTPAFATRTTLASTYGAIYKCDFNLDGRADFIHTITTFSAAKPFVLYRNIINTGTSCYECVLDLSISLKSKECGIENLPDLVSGPDFTYKTIGPVLTDAGTGLSGSVLGECSGTPTVFTRGTTSDDEEDDEDRWYANKNNSMDAGSYLLYRTLTVNQRALNIYANNYLKHNSCLKTYDEFETEAIAEMDFTNCDVSCAERKRRLGSDWTTSVYHTNLECGTTYPCISSDEYDKLKAAWDKECGEDYTGCEPYLEIMLNDMSPDGQYGKIRNTPQANANRAVPEPANITPPAVDPYEVDPTQFELSVFNEGNLLPQKRKITGIIDAYGGPAWIPNWRYPFNKNATGPTENSYLNENGEVDYVILTKDEAGNFTPTILPGSQNEIIYDVVTGLYKIRPNFLKDVKDFLKYWKPEWAASLLIYHPEYGYYEECLKRAASNRWDNRMLETKTAADANANTTDFGGWSAKPYYGGAYYSYPSQLADMKLALEDFVNKDPYFNEDNDNLLPGERDAFIQRLITFNETADSRTIWDLAYQLVHNAPDCTSPLSYPSPIHWSGNPGYLGNNPDPEIANKEWEMFKSLYRSLKQEVIKRHDTRIAIRDGFYNGCISTEAFNVNKDLFSRTYFENPVLSAPSSSATMNDFYPGFYNNKWSYYLFHTPKSGLSFANTQIYNPLQPCVESRYQLYQGKQARFYPEISMPSLSQAQVCEQLEMNYSAFAVPLCQDKVNALTQKGADMTSARLADNCKQCKDAAFMTTLLTELAKDESTTSYPITPCIKSKLDAFKQGIIQFLNNNSGYTFTTNDNILITSSFTSNVWTIGFGAGSFSSYININLPGVSTLSEIQKICCLRMNGDVSEDPEYNIYTFELTVQKRLKPGDTGYNGLFDKVPMIGGLSNLAQVTVSGTALRAKSLVNCEKNVFFRLLPIATTIQSFLNGLSHNGQKPLVNLYTSSNYSTAPVCSLPWTSTQRRNKKYLSHLVLSNCDNTRFTPNYAAAFFTQDLAPYSLMKCSEPLIILNTDDMVVTTEEAYDPWGSACKFIFHDMRTAPYASVDDSVEFEGFLDQSRSFVIHNTESIPFNDFRYFDNVRVENGVVKMDGYYYKTSVGIKKTVLTLSSDKILLNEPGTDLMNEAAYGENRVLHEKSYSPVPYARCAMPQSPLTFLEFRDSELTYPLVTDCDYSPGAPLQAALALLINGLPDNNSPVPFKEGQFEAFFNNFCGDCDLRFESAVDLSGIRKSHVQGIGRVYGSKNAMMIYIGETEATSQPLVAAYVSCEFRPRCTGIIAPPKPSMCYELCAPLTIAGTDFGRKFSEDITPDPGCNEIEPIAICRWHSSFNPEPGDGWLEMYDPDKRSFETDLTPDHHPRLYTHVFGTGGIFYTLEAEWSALTSAYCMLQDGNGASDCHAQPYTMFMKLPGNQRSMIWGKEDIAVEKNSEYMFRFELYNLNTVTGGYVVKAVINGKTLTTITYNNLFEFPWNSDDNTTADIEIYVENKGASWDYLYLGLNNIMLYKECKPTLCCPVETPKVIAQSNCRVMLMNIAKDNAAKKYQEYLADVRRVFQQNYIEKCLDVYEDFSMRYEDDEHHFTLYYYDQAGNLVRTVPPAGVNPIRDQATLDKVKKERALGKRTVFTDHAMATTYRYNSLNQLVYQSTPDHDNVNDVRVAEHTGVFSGNVVINDFDFPGNGSIGFAVGEDRSGGTPAGHIYKTTDKGLTWQEQVAFNLGDVNDIYSGQYTYDDEGTPVTVDLFYGVGDNGLLITKNDLGKYLASNLPARANLVKIIPVYNSTGNILTLYAAGADGSLFTITYNNGQVSSWQGPGNGLKMILKGNLKDLANFDATGMYATSDNGYIYQSNNKGATWKVINRKNIRIGSVINRSVRAANGTLMVYGASGNLVQAVTDPSDLGAAWTKLNTGFVSNITDAAFATGKIGILLMNSRVHYTANAGASATQVTLPGSYNSANIAAVTYKLGRYFCVTTSGNVLHSTNGTSWSLLDAGTSITGNATSLYVTEVSPGVTPYTCVAIGTSSGKAYYKAIGSPGAAWVTITAASANGINKLYLTYKAAKYHVIAENAARSILYANSTTSSPAFASNSYGTSYSGALYVKPNDEAYVAGSGDLYKTTDFTNLSAWTTFTVASSNTAFTIPDYLDLHQGSRLVALSGEGTIILINPVTVVSPPSNTYETKDLTYNIAIDAALNSIALFEESTISNAKKLGVVGNSGIYLVSEHVLDGVAAPAWVIKPTGTFKKLNSMVNDAINAHELRAVGDKGVVCWLGTNGGSASDLTSYASADLTKIIRNSGQTYIATGNNRLINLDGSVYYDLQPGSARIKALAFDASGSDVFAAGSNGLVWHKPNGSNFTLENAFEPKALKSVSMADSRTGVAVGNEGSIWRTENGGASWSQVDLPERTGTNLVKVHFNNNNHGVVIGKDPDGSTTAVAFRTTDAGATWAVMPDLTQASYTYNTISGQGNTYVIAGNSNLVYLSRNGGENWALVTLTGTSKNLYAAHMSTDQSIFVGGADGYMHHIDLFTDVATADRVQPNIPISDLPANTISDIYFTDDKTGYATVNGNHIWKTTDGGEKWEQLVTLGSSISNMKLNAADRERIFILGDNGSNPREFSAYDMKNELSTYFYYDRLGRLVLSRNSKQFDVPGSPTLRRYSYTLYDFKGRISEVGEAQVSTSNTVEKLYVNGKLDETLFASWIAGATKRQVTKTYYDVLTLAGNLPLSFVQKNLRNRVTASTYQETYSASVNNYDYGVHYNYDIHGNVNEMLTENRAISVKMGVNAGYDALIFKHTSYSYDLLSGKVNRVNYQEGKPDQFFHRYTYDEQNKLTAAHTSTDGFNWEQDANYEYYLHGPLARTELGDEHVQGLDYTYTLQGWLKAVNGPRLDAPAYDLGEDGSVAGDHISFARDEAGFMLGYYTNDHTAVDIDAADNPVITTASSDIQPADQNSDLYNGNIGHMVTAIRKLDPSGPLASRYGYDQLNRLTSATYYNNFNAGDNAWRNDGIDLADHLNTFTYDANGNIKTQLRNGSSAINTDMDELEYVYDSGRNRLKGVNDSKNSLFYIDDINNQGVSVGGSYRNYEYDGIGNLVADKAEEIERIDWNVYGKITRITRVAGSAKPDLEFTYAADGQRVSKKVIPKTGFPEVTFYSRDAQGNVMATYTKNYSSDIYIDGLAYRNVNDELLALIGQSNFENFIYHMLQQGVPSFTSSLENWYASNTSAIDLSQLSPVKALTNPVNLTLLSGIPINEVKGAFTTSPGQTTLFFSQLCECLTKPDLMNLILYDENSFNEWMLQMQTMYPGIYYGSLAGITWTDYLSTEFSTVFTAFASLSCNEIGMLMLNYQMNNPAQYENFWDTNFELILNRVQMMSGAFMCQNTALLLVNSIYNYNPSALYDHLLSRLGIEAGYFSFLSANDPLMMLQAVFAYDMSLDPGSTEHISQVMNGSGMSISQYMSIIQGYITSGQYATLLQNLQPSSPAVVEKTYVNERYLYGSSRLGSYNQAQLLGTAKFTASYANGSFAGVNIIETPVINTLPAPVSGLATQAVNRGYKNFELANHLGNVLAVVSDRKTQSETIEYTDIYEYSPYVESLWQPYNSGYAELYSDSYSEGVLIEGDDVNGGALPLDGLQAGRLYVIEFEIASASISSGNIKASVDEGTPVSLYTGKHYLVFRATAPTATLRVFSDGSYFEMQLDKLTLKSINHYNAEVVQANDYSPFGAPMQGRTYSKGQHDKVVVDQKDGTWDLTGTGWKTILCAPLPCVSPEASITVSQSSGKLKMQATKMYSQMYYPFATVPGRVYKVKYKLSGSTITLVSTSLFAPGASTELYTSSNMSTFGVDRELYFTATETTTRFYVTKGWSPTNPTPLQEVSLDYLLITEEPTGIDYISCQSINDNLVMLSNSGVNVNDTNVLKVYLNVYYHRSYSDAYYRSLLSHCSSNPTTFVLPQRSTEKDESFAYRFGFNGQENDNETYGTSNAIDFGARIHDPRIGRFLSIDPLTKDFPELTPYQFANDNPIANIDVDGMSAAGGGGPSPSVRPSVAPRLPAQSPGRAPAQPGRAPTPNGGGQGPAGGATPSTPARPIRLGDYIEWDATGHATFNPPASGLKPQPAPSAATIKAAEEWKNATPEQKQEQLDKISQNQQQANAPVIKTQNQLTIKLYRGVHAKHPDLPNAVNGVATPKGGHDNPLAHNTGNNSSIYTSWTFYPSVANTFGSRKGIGGVVLEKEFSLSEIVISPDIHQQGEVLVPGTVTGATVKPAVPQQ